MAKGTCQEEALGKAEPWNASKNWAYLDNPKAMVPMEMGHKLVVRRAVSRWGTLGVGAVPGGAWRI